MSRSSRAALCALLTAATGCDGLGRAIVSEGDFRPGDPILCPLVRPKCEPLPPVAPASDAAPVDRDLRPCPFDDPTEPVLRELELVSCELRGARFQNIRELVNVQLRNVRIELAPGQALSVRESEWSQVAVVPAQGGEETQGELLISHSRLWGTLIANARVRLVSASVEQSSIEARELDGDDVQFLSSEVSATRATLAALELRRSELRGGEAGFLIAAGTLTDSRVACQGRLQLYASGVDDCSLDGELEAQSASFEDTVFGIEHPTRIVGFGLVLHNNLLCDQVEGLRSSGGSASCNDCEGPLRDGEAEGETCVDPVKSTQRENNACDALQNMPVCAAFPEPRRPIGVP
ncbi:MAG TPA: hypothetical protein VFZ61_18490 [Polyangiales bacterium]